MKVADEKYTSEVFMKAQEAVDSLDEIQWTEQEEKKLVRKIDRLVMPLLMFAFFGLQLDRGNIGNAVTNNFMEDVGITQGQFNIGQQLLSLGIVLWEIPSNMVLYRIGPSIWLSGQIFCWGLVATFQSFQHGLGAYLATRFLLGTCESGFIPASFYTITRWYKKDETSKRFSIFFLGNMIVQAAGGDIAYGILHMEGVAGLHGWQWLFIIEGLITISAGVIFIIFFPRSPQHPVCLSNIKYFNEREIQILVQRVWRDDPTKHPNAKIITKGELKRTFTNWRLLPHALLTLCGLSPCNTLLAYGPSLVESWGYGALKSNAMNSIGPWIQVVINVCFGFTADKLGVRGPVVLAGGFMWWLFLLVSRILVFDPNGHTRFAMLTLAYSFSQVWHPINGSWMALNARSTGERSITMAILIMCANAAGIMGSQFFQASDAPNYENGFTIIVSLVSLALVAMIWANVQYIFINRRLKKEGSSFRYQQ